MEEWKMQYTSFTRCTEKITFENNITLNISQVADKLNDISNGKFEKQWSDYIVDGIHLKLEQMDSDFDFKNMLAMLQDKKLAKFFEFHMQNTIYDWNYLQCGNEGCDKTARFTCIACKSKRYCGVECQRNDWKHHKTHCITT